MYVVWHIYVAPNYCDVIGILSFCIVRSRMADWTPPNASYRLTRYENNPKKIENYEPGSSSAVQLESYVVRIKTIIHIFEVLV